MPRLPPRPKSGFLGARDCTLYDRVLRNHEMPVDFDIFIHLEGYRITLSGRLAAYFVSCHYRKFGSVWNHNFSCLIYLFLARRNRSEWEKVS